MKLSDTDVENARIVRDELASRTAARRLRRRWHLSPMRRRKCGAAVASCCGSETGRWWSS